MKQNHKRLIDEELELAKEMTQSQWEDDGGPLDSELFRFDVSPDYIQFWEENVGGYYWNNVNRVGPRADGSFISTHGDCVEARLALAKQLGIKDETRVGWIYKYD